ncbi:hypothetical protein M9458_034477, partial [Cirrhinus mrigala]
SSCMYNCGYNLGSCSCNYDCQYYGNCCSDYDSELIRHFKIEKDANTYCAA